MKIEIGTAHKDARQHLLAAVEGAAYPVALTVQNHAPGHLFVKFYMAGAGQAGSKVTHTFVRRDEISRWVTDLEQIAMQNNYACICSVDLDDPEPQQPDQNQGQQQPNNQDAGANPESTPASSEVANASTESVTDSAEKKPVGRPPKATTTPEGGAQ